MKKQIQLLSATGNRLGRKEQKLVRGGTGSFARYWCQVSPDGYTAGAVCIPLTHKPAAICKRCFGVSYAVFDGYTSYCPSECLPG
jgi:hypothetical protein